MVASRVSACLVTAPVASSSSSSSSALRRPLRLSSSSAAFALPRRSLSSSLPRASSEVVPEPALGAGVLPGDRQGPTMGALGGATRPGDRELTPGIDSPQRRLSREEQLAKVAMDRESNRGFASWSKNAGEQWKWPTPGRNNFLGGDMLPFPENPYFKPTPPLSTALQAEIYAKYTQYPSYVTSIARVNHLAEKYAISKDRIRGMIKTGQVAESWKRLKLPTQNAFVRGMETLLLVPSHTTARRPHEKSPAMADFPTYLPSRIDLDRDLESAAIERGERTDYHENSGFRESEHLVVSGRKKRDRIGMMSWEFAEEGHTANSAKADLERPLRPPPVVPEFPNKIVATGGEAVWNFVNVGDKFAGQAWDGFMYRGGNSGPSKRKTLKRYMHLVMAKKNLSGQRNPRALTARQVLSPREKARLQYVDKLVLRAQGTQTATGKILEGLARPGQELRTLRHERIQRAKADYQKKRLASKDRSKMARRKEAVQDFKRRLQAKDLK